MSNKVLIIIRGIPGAGKSTLANKLVGEGIIHSTDTLIEEAGDYGTFFLNLKGTDGSALSKMHHNNLLNAKKSINKGISPVIIDNTNIKAGDVKAYVEYALKKGYKIKIEDIGTNDLDAKTLANRNSHGVPLEKIENMIKSYKSVGELTIEKIMNAKSKNKKFVWSSAKLDDKSRGRLLAKIGHLIPPNWKVIAEHMTLSFGKTLDSLGINDLIGETVSLKIIGYGMTDMAFAVKVEGFEDIIKDRTPHITIAINDKNGAKPVNSNDIQNWFLFKDNNETYITISGKVTEVIN